MSHECFHLGCSIKIIEKDLHNLCTTHRSCNFIKNCSICAKWDLLTWKLVYKANPSLGLTSPSSAIASTSAQIHHYQPHASTSDLRQGYSDIDPTFSVPQSSNFCPGTTSTSPVPPVRQPRSISPSDGPPSLSVHAPVASRGVPGSPTSYTDDGSDVYDDVLTLHDPYESLVDAPVSVRSVNERTAMNAVVGVLPKHVIPAKLPDEDSFVCTGFQPARPQVTQLRLAPEFRTIFTGLDRELKKDRFQKTNPVYFTMSIPTQLPSPSLIPESEFPLSLPEKDTSAERISTKPESVSVTIPHLNNSAKMHRAALLSVSEATTFCETLSRLVSSATSQKTMLASEFCRDISPIVSCIGLRLGNLMPIVSRDVANDVLLKRDAFLAAGRFTQDSSNQLRSQSVTARTIFADSYKELKDDLVRAPVSRKRAKKSTPATDYATKYAPPEKKQRYDDYRPPTKRSSYKPPSKKPAQKKSFRPAGGKRGRR